MKSGRPTLLLAALLLTACVSAVSNVSAPSPSSTPSGDLADWRYALVLDASSSATTLFVYQWRTDEPLPRIVPAPFPYPPGETEPWSARVRPGLSAHASQPAEAGKSLAPLLEFARNHVPAAEHARTPVHLRATAGVRRLPMERREAILAAVDEVLAASPFAPTPARVLSGEEEAVYGWLTVNYLLGHLEHGGVFPTVGALDLGGASTQITFAPLDHPAEGSQVVRLGDTTYHLYARSYLGLGQDVVRDELDEPACYPRGFGLDSGKTGSGSFATCRAAIRTHLARACGGSRCRGLGESRPALYGDFLAFSVYAYTADHFELGGRLAPAELANAGAEFCAASWPERVARDPALAENPFVPRYCFAAAYIVELLTEGFGFSPATERIHAPLRVQGAETGWTLGALLYELAGNGD